MKLYDLELSGNCYKVRLFASFANLALSFEAVDFFNAEHKSTSFMQLNPWAEVPVLTDGTLVLRDAQAILVYLANKYAGEAWWPSEAHLQADVMQWLSVAANELQHGPNKARLVKKFNVDSDYKLAESNTHTLCKLINNHLQTNTWLAANRPTIAECAIFPYIALAHEGNIDLSNYESLNLWLNRVKQLPNFISMPGIK
ncbi:glutathione S-transferase [Pseudoalteromonas haloplanktis]|uniref:Glutathione S-transferase n=1 Tax=Pseudoalteromonas haloplanktis TaxID=228 RepID=A0ABU1B7Y0_PSEHA|nr:glutathione S-transferase [Pseudoalteromonas haloplanktis]MDQ9090362.1 glutathione S-transferase [Pseudoalteromonas haloplanktis]